MLEWLRNRQKTLTETDSARLRRLESKLLGIEDDLSKTFDLVDRINARLRQRARRLASDDAGGPDDVAVNNRDGDVGRELGVPHLESTQPAPGNGAVKYYTKDQLKQFAAAKGIRA